MRNINEIVINRIALNILDKENDHMVCCESDLELSEEVYEYFEKHIIKSLKDEDAKTARFDGERNIVAELCKEIFSDEDIFMENSKKLTHILFKAVKNDEDAASGDFAICIFEAEIGRYIAMLKMDYNCCYAHYIREVDGKSEVHISKSQTGLPSTSQKIQKAAIVKEKSGENDFEILLVDKQYDGYFSKSFLNCSLAKDIRENTKTIRSVSESFARKAFKDNAAEAENFRNKVTDILRNEDRFNIEKLVEQSFNDEGTKNEYKAALVSEGIDSREIMIDREWAEKKLKRKKLKVDKSIELYIDCEAYNDKNKFQIKTNGDGTIDIIIKNVRNYIEK